jgi:hypothetical protein
MFSPSRSQILADVQRADFNPLALRVARFIADYELTFEIKPGRFRRSTRNYKYELR